MKIQVFLVIRGRYVPFQIDANTETANNEVYEFSFHVKKISKWRGKNSSILVYSHSLAS